MKALSRPRETGRSASIPLFHQNHSRPPRRVPLADLSSRDHVFEAPSVSLAVVASYDLLAILYEALSSFTLRRDDKS